MPLHNKQSSSNENHLTVVIVTARPEFKRLPLTLAALACHLDPQYLVQVLLLVPPNDASLLQRFFNQGQAEWWPWPVSIRSDDTLLKHHRASSYQLQMMFKLFLAQIVETEYYLILDSDCVAVSPINISQLLHPMGTEKGEQRYQAIYTRESRNTHEDWWRASSIFIRSSLENCSRSKSEAFETVGVTPFIMSRTIALRTLCGLQKLYGRRCDDLRSDV